MAQTVVAGLVHSESDANWRFGNVRRSVFYNYPNGSAPLVAFLSLMGEEETNDPAFTIYEKRLVESSTTTAALNAAGPLGSSSSVDLANQADPVVGDTIFIKVASTARFRVGHIIKITDLATGVAGATLLDMKAKVTAITSSTILQVYNLEAFSDYYQNAANVGKEVLVIGNAAEEGQVGAALAPYQLPDPFINYTQIFRTPSRITGTAMKTALKFDARGIAPDKLKDACLQHAIEMEMAFLFGIKTAVATGTDGQYTRTTGGIIWYLRQWELGTVYGNATGAITGDSTDGKRIIDNTAGTISMRTWNNYLERLFRVTNNSSNSKLVLCGSGFLSTMNDLYIGKTAITANTEVKSKFGWDIREQLTPWGSIFYVTHPLFSRNATLRYSALALDTGNLKYRYLTGRDSQLLKNRQPNNADYIEHEWFGEAGLQLTMPESHMFFRNFTQAVP